MFTPVRVGVTLGDPSGIGPEIVAKALSRRDILPAGVEFVVLGKDDPRLARVIPGQPSRLSAEIARDNLEIAARLLKNGEIDAVATGPVSKEYLHQVGYTWPGQTEFFAERLGVEDFSMCLTGPTLTVGLVTIHVALADVPRLVTSSQIVRTGKLLAGFCRQRGDAQPRIAVCGLNPHAGENGDFGDEEARVIQPAIDELRQLCPWATFTGPHIPDAIFRDAARGAYDAVLAMYHDQGLIPLKLLDFDTAVNVTLGLPRIRTSPDHGTAFAIAGKGIASESSMLAALELAARTALNSRA